MKVIRYLTVWLLCARTRLRADERERGDVPGWVMVTVVTMASFLRPMPGRPWPPTSGAQARPRRT
jgi:hypothetical protein